MILQLVNCHQKKIAFGFLYLFSFNLIVPGTAAAAANMASQSSETRTASGSLGYFMPNPVVKNDGAPARNNEFIFGPGEQRQDDFKKQRDNDIDGPGQPEMKSFQSVNADNMVDLFTGDFSYSIPLLDVGGYPVNLHYSSGINMDQEASWVGLGWNVNPGSISRSMRGLPDDFDGVNDSLKRTQHVKENKTTGVTIEPSLEVIGNQLDVSARLGIFYNNYNGYGLETGVGIGGTGKASFGSLTSNLSISNNSQEGIRINPSLKVSFGKNDESEHLRSSLGISTGYSSRAGVSSLQINGGIQSDQRSYQKMILASPGANFPLASISFATPSYSPTISMPIKNTMYSFTGKIGGEVWGMDASASFTGYVNSQTITAEDTTQVLPAAGYIYSVNANGRENILLDFNREKDMEFNYKSTPHIALPQYTYDAFSISGEGTGGSFRPYRGDIGYVFDHSIATKSSSTNGSIDVGTGAAAHLGLEITNMTSNTTNHRWNHSNEMESKIQFLSADTTFEPVYFRNPGEKTTNAESYYRSIGNDSLVRIKLGGDKQNKTALSTFIKYNNDGREDAELPVTGPLVKKQRDKRTQVISYLTAADASVLGLDKTIKSIPEDSVPVGSCLDIAKSIPRVDGSVRKKNHLSEISVLNSDGRKYVYGLPIYNVVQKDVTFAVDRETNSSNLNKGLVSYTPGDNSTNNTKGKDNYFSKEETPAYAHNFLLTGILSPDYVDITGNGISEDDPGDAIKFNYSQVYGIDSGYFDWRTPFQENRANYNEGLKTYNRDDKGTYLYGKKEMWYLNSIESKTMIAVFSISRDRKDAYAVAGENGNVDKTKSSRRLEKIDLYVKADIVKNGIAKAKPIKTVHFSYNYELCKGAQGIDTIGKLTLKTVWFTYNKNGKGKLNPYVFSYHPDTDGNPDSDFNPNFNSKFSDRWGTYKNPESNPGDLNNADFPYSVQDSATAANNASVWNLTDIQLPSGGRMHITYESDDYGYVQNRRATQMTTIAGIGQSSGNHLYNFESKDKEDYYTIYVNTAVPLKNRQDIKDKYLSVDDIMYFKLAVTMPKDQFGSGVEMVPGYGTVEDYGITPGNTSQFWVRLAPVDGRSPLSRAALQFLRLNLHSKAYPGSEGVESRSISDLIKLMATSFSETKNMIQGFDKASKTKNICNSIDLSQSFVRLSSPNLKKYGGGYRVKRVEVYDNWKKMTNQKESVYGQEYTYATTENVNGQLKSISSGVATYEPAIGGEENPFRRPINYSEKVAPMAPVNYMFSEEPVGETFFGSPMVGYSKVRVRTINAKARSANGWEETEFFTSRDFPTRVEHSLLEEDKSRFKYETQSNILRLNHKNYATLSQGFKIELNDMNGKVKAQSTFAETDPLHPIKYSLNFYKVDDDKASLKHLNNQVWVVDSINGHINTEGQVGKDIELMVDLREQQSQAYTQGFSPNVDVIAPFLPFIPVLVLPSRINLPQKEDTRYRSAATVKVIQRYGILDSVVVMDKGSVVSTKNILYDGETGNVLLSRTNNEFNDPIYNFNYPAYWSYSGMDLAYKNIGAVFQAKSGTGGLQLNKGILFKEASTELYPVERFFESGDEVYVYSAKLAQVASDCRRLTPSTGAWQGKLWVINAAKGVNKNKGLYFIDSLGRIPSNMIIQKMVIVRSGKRNMVDVSAGSVVMMNNPLKLVSGQYRVVIDSNSRVLNASAATFKDLWQVENSQYQEDSCYTIVRAGTDTLYSSFGHATTAIFREAVYVKKGKNITFFPVANVPSTQYATSTLIRNVKGNSHNRYSLKSIMKFNLGYYYSPADSITNAVLHLNGGAPTAVWTGVADANVQFFAQKTAAHNDEGDRNGRTNAGKIKQVIAPWNTGIGFNDLLTSSTDVDVASAAHGSCDNRTPDVTTLVRDMVKHPERDNGLLLSLADIVGDISEDNRSERTLGFCAKTTGNPSPPVCVNCNTSYLVVSHYSAKDTCVKLCRNNIVDSATNPYRWGVLGNWRMERAYTYYNSRQENDATAKSTNIRQEGTLKAFVPYWSFSSAGITPSVDSSRWVWNSAISTFNKKGFEIENFDPLGRYNAGLYGYNQTLPVAVAQNSRYREILSDGFEDYGFKTTYCATCPPKREFDFINGNTGVDTTTSQSHTGLYSVKINSGYEALLTVPIDSTVASDTIPGLSARIDSSSVGVSAVVGAGEGLAGDYSLGRSRGAGICLIGFQSSGNRLDPGINFDWTTTPPITPGVGECTGTYRVSWTGTIQPRYTDVYTFYLLYNGTASITVDGQILYAGLATQSGERATEPIFLQSGHVYSISITYTKTAQASPGPVQFSWSSFASQQKEIVPAQFLYPDSPESSDTVGSIAHSVQYYCPMAHVVKPKKVIRQVFSPMKNSKITVSAWVRLDVEDCNTTPVLDSVIQVQFNTGATAWLKKTGLRIEGWQRYETNVDVPGNAATMYLRLKTLAAYNIYVDDVRVQPFNSGMKGFVYNPVNLRLMSELDENNYASFYEYDDDGTLIRIKKETERGIMTIQETRSALLKDQ